jgi:hypothetical protein
MVAKHSFVRLCRTGGEEQPVSRDSDKTGDRAARLCNRPCCGLAERIGARGIAPAGLERFRHGSPHRWERASRRIIVEVNHFRTFQKCSPTKQLCDQTTQRPSMSRWVNPSIMRGAPGLRARLVIRSAACETVASSIIRLIGAVLFEQNDDWQSQQQYMMG